MKKKPFKIDETHLSVSHMFKIGVGPSSSHTVGPMLAGWCFGSTLEKLDLLESTCYICIELYGSLALTGSGHMTDSAVMVGLSGNRPNEVKSHIIPKIIKDIKHSKTIKIMNKKLLPFVEKEHLLWHFDTFLPEHPNGLRITALSNHGKTVLEKTYFSTGGGDIVDYSEQKKQTNTKHNIVPKYPYHGASELLAICKKNNISVAKLQRENEAAWMSNDKLDEFLDTITQVMFECIESGTNNEGILPGSLKIKRRAKSLHKIISERSPEGEPDALAILDWVNLYALAVNEENAACGRVVTAPTNGAAGVIPAVLKYYVEFCGGTKRGVRNFLLCAGAIGTLYKKRASISAAAVGCQGEVGVACSMAAAGLTSALGGTNMQIESAAEIGMEHNLGLTCDPIDGLVQVPCIERNTMGAVKAINASRLALSSDGEHYVSLDSCIETMRQTGEDMQSKYKETAQGGLAVNFVEC